MVRSLALQNEQRAWLLRDRVVMNRQHILLKSIMSGWRQAAADMVYKARKSTMIMLFSSWRLYVKEQVLMRRYLHHLDTPARSPASAIAALGTAPNNNILFASAVKAEPSPLSTRKFTYPLEEPRTPFFAQSAIRLAALTPVSETATLEYDDSKDDADLSSILEAQEIPVPDTLGRVPFSPNFITNILRESPESIRKSFPRFEDLQPIGEQERKENLNTSFIEGRRLDPRDRVELKKFTLKKVHFK